MADTKQADSRRDETKTDVTAVYYDISPCVVLAVRLFGLLVTLMVAISFVLALVKGTDNPTFYLLACNVIISSFVAVILAWWYRGGDLPSEKYWLLILVGCVIIVQCITTDIYVFHVIPVPQDLTTTISPNRSSYMTTHNTTHNTTNKSMEALFYTEPATPVPIELTTVDFNGFT